LTHQASDKRPVLGKWKVKAGTRKGDSTRRPGPEDADSARVSRDPGVIPEGGNPPEEAARFPMEGNREERRGETLTE